MLIPCGQEARGLDAGPRLVRRLMGHGDLRSAAIIRRISEEEKAHVAIGEPSERRWGRVEREEEDERGTRAVCKSLCG